MVTVMRAFYRSSAHTPCTHTRPCVAYFVALATALHAVSTPGSRGFDLTRPRTPRLERTAPRDDMERVTSATYEAFAMDVLVAAYRDADTTASASRAPHRRTPYRFLTRLFAAALRIAARLHACAHDDRARDANGALTLRDLYYLDRSAAARPPGRQTSCAPPWWTVDMVHRGVDKLCALLAGSHGDRGEIGAGVQRYHLGVTAAPKGLVYSDAAGAQLVLRHARRIALASAPFVPPEIEEPGVLRGIAFPPLAASPSATSSLPSSASRSSPAAAVASTSTLLLVEKETTFRRLADAAPAHAAKLAAALGRYVLVTGKGYPDIATQRLVTHLAANAHHDHGSAAFHYVAVLTDCDVDGVAIAHKYFACLGAGGTAQCAATTAKTATTTTKAARFVHLGVHAHDLEQFGLRPQDGIRIGGGGGGAGGDQNAGNGFSALSERDRRVARGLRASLCARSAERNDGNGDKRVRRDAENGARQLLRALDDLVRRGEKAPIEALGDDLAWYVAYKFGQFRRAPRS